MTSIYLLFFSLVCFFDFWYRKVPNLLLVIMLVFGLVALFSGYELFFGRSWAAAVFGFFGGLVFFLPLWVKKIMGAGDVKFIAVLGFMLGWKFAGLIVLVSGLFAGSHSVFQALQIRKEGFKNKRERRGVPYAGYIALTAIIWLIWKLLE